MRRAGNVSGARRTTRLMALSGLAGAVLLLGGSPALAAPSNAKSALSGSFDCGSAGTGTFVVNTGNAMATTWNAASLSFTGGGTGIFTPTSFNLADTFDGQPAGTEVATKREPAGSATCSIAASASFGGHTFSVSGTVVGNIIHT